MIHQPPNSVPGRRAGPGLRCLAFFLLAGLFACQAGPPVQEMSDARQAITAAREAGADEVAAVEIQEAERHLDNAEDRLNRKDYAQARREALQAKRSALEALSIIDKKDDKKDN